MISARHAMYALSFYHQHSALMREQERDGWYSSHAFERIKAVLRHKFFSLLDGHVASDEECRTLLMTNEGSAKTVSTRNHRLRAGKHNMAKGALRPEDAAVCPLLVLHFSIGPDFQQAMRLRATLDRNAKTSQSSR